MPRSWWALRHQPDLLKLATGQGISAFGSQVTLLALPLTAVAVLGASPAEMGILGAAQLSPYLLFGLVAGAWVDRIRRRPVLVAADLGRALLLGSIPLAMLLGIGSMTYLCVVAFLTSSLSVLASTAYQSYLPSVVPRERLVEANGSLEASRSLARVAGPSVGGGLVQSLTAPVAILVDALSFVVSGLLLLAIRTPETEPAPASSAPASPARSARGCAWCCRTGACGRSPSARRSAASSTACWSRCSCCT